MRKFYVGLAEKFSRANSDAVQLAQWLFRTLASPFNRRSLTKMQGFQIETLKNLALFFKKSPKTLAIYTFHVDSASPM